LFPETGLPSYDILIKNIVLVMAGYVIATLETMLARALGLTSISYGEVLFIAGAVFSYAMASYWLVYLNRRVTLLIDSLVYYGNLTVYLAMYGVWIYKLGEIRTLGLFNALIAVTIVLTYTPMSRSLMMSLGTVACHLVVSRFAIYDAGQPGSFAREIFYTIAFVPAFLIISYFAGRLQRQNAALGDTNRELEKANLDLTRANEELEATRRVTEIEMDLAVTIQSAIFPDAAPQTDEWDVAFSFKPRNGVSGDFYDFYYEGPVLRGMSLFDVSGHGVSSALITMFAKPIFFRHFTRMSGGPLHRVIEAANLRLIDEMRNIHGFITGIMLRFGGGSVEYVNAGHPDLLHRRSGRGVRVIGAGHELIKGRPLGIEGPTRTCKTVKFGVAPGDVLVLYTDCVTECVGAANNSYGVERLIASFERAPGEDAGAILEFIERQFHDFLGDRRVEDDFTLIVARKR
ncbi:MAG: serine/threonine-protein phosphatase, partial [Spirochaetes bacterium]